MTKKVSVDARMGDGFLVETEIRHHSLRIDQTKAGGGNDQGPTPLEYLLIALSGCIASIARIMAHQRKIELRGLEIHVEGEIDVSRLLGHSTENRTGFQSIELQVKMDSDMSLEEQQAFLEEVDQRCPISENLMNSTPITIKSVA